MKLSRDHASKEEEDTDEEGRARVSDLCNTTFHLKQLFKFSFATTSIPKKVVAQAQPEPVTEPEPNVEIADEHIESKIPGDNVTHLDEQELKMQGLVDRCQEKIEKEILRTMKASGPFLPLVPTSATSKRADNTV